MSLPSISYFFLHFLNASLFFKLPKHSDYYLFSYISLHFIFNTKHLFDDIISTFLIK